MASVVSRNAVVVTVPVRSTDERQAQGGRDGLVLGLVHGGVEQHDPGELVGVVDRPAEGDDSAPVVAEGDDRTRDAEFSGEVAEVLHALAPRARGRPGRSE